MSVTDLTKVLLRAIEARDSSDPATRATVYDLARKTFARFLNETEGHSEADRLRQIDEFDRVIDLIEAHYASGGEVPLPASLTGASEPPPAPAPLAPPPLPREAAGSPPPPEPEPVASRHVVATPPPPPPVVAEVDAPIPEATASEDAPSDVPPMIAATASDAGRDDVETETKTAEKASSDQDDGLFTGTPPTDGDPADAADVDPHVIARRNRRGAITLILLLLGMGVIYRTDVLSELRHRIFGDALPPSVIAATETTAVADAGFVATWSSVVAPRMAAGDGASTTAAFLWDETAGPAATGMTGRIGWSPRAAGTPSRTGTLVSEKRGSIADFALDVADATPGGSGRLLMVSIPSLSERSSGTPSLFRVSPGNGDREEIAGAAVRIGLDRFLFSFQLRPDDTAAPLDRRTVWQIVFVLDDERQVHLFFRLPAGD